MSAQRLSLVLLAASCAFISACSGSKAQVLQYQAEKEQLTEVIRKEREMNNSLKERSESLAKRLDEAEKELAIAQGRGTRLSRVEPTPPSTSGSSAPIREPAPTSAPAATVKAAPEEKLPWRPARTGSKPSSAKGSENR